jgi:hypothetical protein
MQTRTLLTKDRPNKRETKVLCKKAAYKENTEIEEGNNDTERR